jgi:hypothetical protein
LIVGAPNFRNVSQADRIGATYLFERDTNGSWHETQILFQPTPLDRNAFGGAVAISPKWFAVGAPSSISSRGQVYIYDSPSNPTLLMAPSPQTGGVFGSSISLSGDTLAVGARGTSHTSNTGSVFLYENRNGSWSGVQELLSSTANSGGFGTAVDLTDTHLIVGAFSSNRNVNGGQAFIYEKHETGWGEKIELSQIAPGFKDAFGHSVAITDRFAVVGAPGNTGRQTSYPDGAVFVYERDQQAGWVFRQVLVPFAPTIFPQFGRSVSIQGNWLLVGAPADQTGGVNNGSGFLFALEGNTWQPAAVLRSAVAVPSQSLGDSAYIGDGFFALGGAASTLGTQTPLSGRVLFFVPEPSSVWLAAVIACATVLSTRSFRRYGFGRLR